MTLGFEPEPGMLVDSLDGYENLRAALGAPSRFGLTLDLGHCQCTEPQPPAGCIARAAPWLVNVHIEDMRRGIHKHLDLGEGEIDFPAALAALRAVGYQGLVVVQTTAQAVEVLRDVDPACRPVPGRLPPRPAPRRGDRRAGRRDHPGRRCDRHIPVHGRVLHPEAIEAMAAHRQALDDPVFEGLEGLCRLLLHRSK